MKRSRLTTDPARAAERRRRREERRAADGPRPEDLAREARRTALQAASDAIRREAPKPQRRLIGEASPDQRAAVADKACIVCREQPCDPAHLIPRGLCADGDGDARAVVPLCRAHHRVYDSGALDLLPFLEPGFRTELAFAVERHGLLSTVRRVTNERDYPRPAA